MIAVDDALRKQRRDTGDALVEALIASYDHATTHISEFAKLQYQLVAIAYGLAGAAIAFFGDQLSQPQAQVQGTFLLALPVIFYAIVFVQVYLHSQIKRYGRYVNYKLRPKMEAIIQTQLNTQENLELWDWEEMYKRGVTPSFGTKLEGILTRILSLLILVLPLIPALGAILLFELIIPGRALTEAELFLRGANVVGLVLAVALIGIIGYVNLTSLENEGKKYAENVKAAFILSLSKQIEREQPDPLEDEVVAGLIEDETDPVVLMQGAFLARQSTSKLKILQTVRQIRQPRKVDKSKPAGT